jgi:hypothetical protein
VGDEHAVVGSAGLRSRRRSPVGKREPRGLLRYTDDEWAVIVQVAALERLKPGAWAQRAAYQAAVQQHHGQVPDRGVVEVLVAELRQHRRVLTNIGGNLNDLARAANATGRIENAVAVATVLRLVRNVVAGVDEVVRRVRAELLG